MKWTFRHTTRALYKIKISCIIQFSDTPHILATPIGSLKITLNLQVHTPGYYVLWNKQGACFGITYLPWVGVGDGQRTCLTSSSLVRSEELADLASTLGSQPSWDGLVGQAWDLTFTCNAHTETYSRKFSIRTDKYLTAQVTLTLTLNQWTILNLNTNTNPSPDL